MSQHSLHNHDTFSSRGPVLSRKRRTNFGGGFFNAHNLNAWEKRGREAEEKRKEQQRLDEIKRKLDNPRQNMNKYVRQKFKIQAGMFYYAMIRAIKICICVKKSRRRWKATSHETY